MTDVRDLYGLPLERFVAERAALAKELRSNGEPERAQEVAKLRKPSVAAWAVNQLARTQHRAISELLAAGDGLRQVQADVVARRSDARGLREATGRERAAVDELIAAARGLLSSEGHELSAATVDRVRETLHAAALDEDARARVIDGCLEHELRHVGLGEGGVPATSARVRTADRRSAASSPSRRERDERLRAARKAASDAGRAAERAARELRAAQDRRDRAAGELEEAEAALAQARERAEQLQAEQRHAEQALAKLAG